MLGLGEGGVKSVCRSYGRHTSSLCPGGMKRKERKQGEKLMKFTTRHDGGGQREADGVCVCVCVCGCVSACGHLEGQEVALTFVVRHVIEERLQTGRSRDRLAGL